VLLDGTEEAERAELHSLREVRRSSREGRGQLWIEAGCLDAFASTAGQMARVTDHHDRAEWAGVLTCAFPGSPTGFEPVPPH
jgi:hypothetical protein